MEWFLWESIGEGSMGIQKQFKLLEVQVIGGSSYWECTVYYTVTNLYLQLHIPNKSWAKFLKTLLNGNLNILCKTVSNCKPGLCGNIKTLAFKIYKKWITNT